MSVKGARMTYRLSQRQRGVLEGCILYCRSAVSCRASARCACLCLAHIELM